MYEARAPLSSYKNPQTGTVLEKDKDSGAGSLLWQPAKRKKNDYCIINFAFCVIFSGGEFLLSPLPPKLCQSVPLVGGETVKVRMEKKQLEFEKARRELQEAQAQLQAIQVGRIQRRKLQKYV